MPGKARSDMLLSGWLLGMHCLLACVAACALLWPAGWLAARLRLDTRVCVCAHATGGCDLALGTRRRNATPDALRWRAGDTWGAYGLRLATRRCSCLAAARARAYSCRTLGGCCGLAVLHGDAPSALGAGVWGRVPPPPPLPPSPSLSRRRRRQRRRRRCGRGPLTSFVMTRFSVVAVAVMMMVTMILLPPPMLPLALLTPMAALVVLVVGGAHDGWADRKYVLVGRSGCGARARRDTMR